MGHERFLEATWDMGILSDMTWTFLKFDMRHGDPPSRPPLMIGREYFSFYFELPFHYKETIMTVMRLTTHGDHIDDPASSLNNPHMMTLTITEHDDNRTQSSWSPKKPFKS